LMLENAIYSVISPEGCASILWRDPSKSLEAAKAMKLTADELLKINIIDEIINEPVGGAHRDKNIIISAIKSILLKNLAEFKNYTREEIYKHRQEKFLKIGKQKSFSVFSNNQFNLIEKINFLTASKNFFGQYKKKLIIIFFIIFLLVLFLVK